MRAVFSSLEGASGMTFTFVKVNRGRKALLISRYFKKSSKCNLVKGRKNEVQWLVYYVSKRLLDPETRYSELEKLALTLVIVSRKLRPYFYAHTIEVLTNYPLLQARSCREFAQIGI